jgi:hypothetical protein
LLSWSNELSLCDSTEYFQLKNEFKIFIFRAGGVAQVAKHLPRKHKALSSNANTMGKKQRYSSKIK